MFLTDNETKVDLLNNEAIAATIIELLRTKPDQPVTIGVHGDWGAGKSSVLEMIEAKLDGETGVLCLKFNGWRFQGFEDAKIALIEGIVTGLLEKRPALTKAAGAVKEVFRRIDWLKVAKRAGGLAFTAATGIPSPDLILSVVGSLEGLLANPANSVGKESIEAALDGVKSLGKSETETKNVPEEIGAFRKAFDALLKEAGIEQLIVLIDDLDRCLPETAIETLEAVRLFVFTSRTAFVVAADEAMIEYAVRKHFPDLPDTTGPRDYARNYLEKLIQVPFRIPPLGETETRIYVTLLLVGAELGNDDEEYGKLISAARGRLRRPWTSSALDAAAIKEALGSKASRVQDALTISDQIGPILATGSSGNPRQIKRFLNTLLLRQSTAEARGFGDEVKLPVLAKLMLAERFLPRLFDQIALAAASHPRGHCENLVALEESSDEVAEFAPPEVISRPREEAKTRIARDGQKSPKIELASKPTESPIVTEWLSSQPILNWCV
jgi:predicted KAP-like P-loop ATPase